MRPPTRSILFPYTTLFRSVGVGDAVWVVPVGPAQPTAGGRLRDREQPIARLARALQIGIAVRRLIRAQKAHGDARRADVAVRDRKSTRLNSSHLGISYAVF